MGVKTNCILLIGKFLSIQKPSVKHAVPGLIPHPLSYLFKFSKSLLKKGLHLHCGITVNLHLIIQCSYCLWKLFQRLPKLQELVAIEGSEMDEASVKAIDWELSSVEEHLFFDDFRVGRFLTFFTLTDDWEEYSLFLLPSLPLLQDSSFSDSVESALARLLLVFPLFEDLERFDLEEENDFSALFPPLALLDGDLAVEDERDLPLATCDWLLVLTPLGIEMI
jgi:hypothetical protein